MLLVRLAGILKEAIYPSRCIVCGSFFHALSETDSLYSNNYTDITFQMETITFETAMSPYLCPACCRDYIPVESPTCPLCGLVFKSREGEDHLCQTCIEDPKHFGKARSVFLYSKSVMEVIHSFKYKGKLQLAGSLELLLFSVLMQYWKLSDFDIVAPVPLHVKRFRSRGFNQAYILVKNLGKLAKKLMIEPSCLEVGKDILERTIHTQPQTGLGREERIKNIKGAFRVKNLSDVKGKRILLVDDVYTTGATVDECAKALLGGGAENVDVLTLARAV